jgi:hypothetical protein
MSHRIWNRLLRRRPVGHVWYENGIYVDRVIYR